MKLAKTKKHVELSLRSFSVFNFFKVINFMMCNKRTQLLFTTHRIDSIYFYCHLKSITTVIIIINYLLHFCKTIYVAPYKIR